MRSIGIAKPHGLALVIRTRQLRPDVKVIFTGSSRSREAVMHFGDEFIPTPVKLPEALAAVERVMA